MLQFSNQFITNSTVAGFPQDNELELAVENGVLPRPTVQPLLGVGAFRMSHHFVLHLTLKF